MQQADTRARDMAAGVPRGVQAKRAVAAARSQSRQRKIVPAILFACMVVAIISVLLVPVLVGGAAPAAAAEASANNAPPVAQTEQAMASYEDAEAALGFAPALPGAVPEGYKLSAFRVLDEQIFEAEYTSGKAVVLFRTAPGSDDLSGDVTEYAFTLTEEANGVARGYAGVAEKKLNLAVWVNGGYSFALMAGEGMEAEGFKAMAESVK